MAQGKSSLSVFKTMLEPSLLTTGLVFICTFLIAYVCTRRRRGIPPGPPLFPVIGNLPSMAAGDLLCNLQKLHAKYGDILSLYIGKELMIFLNGHKVIHDAFVKKGSQFAGRPSTEFHKMWVKTPGIIFATGTEWKEQRQLTVEIFRNICFKQNGEVIEDIVNSEVNRLTQCLGSCKGTFDIDSFITISVCNVICQVAYGMRYDFGDPVIKSFLQEVQQGAKIFMIAQTLCNCFPFLQKLPFDLIKAQRINALEAKVRSFMESNVENVKADTDCHFKNFVRQYLCEIELNQQEVKKKSVDEHHMVSVLIDLFAAGTETTANTIRWILLYLLGRLDIQDKMYREISAVIGNRPPTIPDRKSLPYTQAVILEGLRIAPAVPLGVPHTVSRDTTFHGYVLPKNCSVLPNISSALKDPEVWPEPEVFQPERFLNKANTEVIVPKEFIPFSLGPRSCLGETFSRIELHLFVTTLFQNFRFLPEVDGQIPEPRGHVGASYSPLAFKMRVEKRSGIK